MLYNNLCENSLSVVKDVNFTTAFNNNNNNNNNKTEM
jgi:hypothetical protein